jgi:hypothetical protein
VASIPFDEIFDRHAIGHLRANPARTGPPASKPA